MADILNTKVGGIDLPDGSGIDAADFNATNDAIIGMEYADNTGGSTTSGTEADLATITVLQNDLNASSTLIINSGWRIAHDATGTTQTGSSTVRLYVNGSAVKSITVSLSSDTGGTFVTRQETGSAFTYRATALDSTAGAIIVKVTGQAISGAGTRTSFCDGLVVEGKNR